MERQITITSFCLRLYCKFVLVVIFFSKTTLKIICRSKNTFHICRFQIIAGDYFKRGYKGNLYSVKEIPAFKSVRVPQNCRSSVQSTLTKLHQTFLVTLYPCQF